jgi:autotransporter-associated beta strand protein
VEKTGTGILTLAAANTFSGDLVIDNGTLVLAGSLGAGGNVIVNTGGTLSGSGASGKPITLNAGGVIAPGVTSAPAALSGTSLQWNGGGRIAMDLGNGSDQLVLSGALTKGAGGEHEFVFTPGISLNPGTTFTIATFASTDLTAADLTYSGLSGKTGTFTVTPTSIQFVVTAGGSTSAYDTWADAYRLPLDRRAPADDFDGDGLKNLVEFALGLDPTKPGNSGLTTETVSVGGEDYPAIRYTRRTDLGNITLEVKVSTTLDFASNLGVVQVSATDKGDGTTEVIARSSVPLSSQAAQFFRVEAK